jgi:hypothetical protein
MMTARTMTKTMKMMTTAANRAKRTTIRITTIKGQTASAVSRDLHLYPQTRKSVWSAIGVILQTNKIILATYHLYRFP